MYNVIKDAAVEIYRFTDKQDNMLHNYNPKTWKSGEDCEFNSTLGYIVSFRPTWPTQEVPVLENQIPKIENET